MNISSKNNMILLLDLCQIAGENVWTRSKIISLIIMFITELFTKHNKQFIWPTSTRYNTKKISASFAKKSEFWEWSVLNHVIQISESDLKVSISY